MRHHIVRNHLCPRREKVFGDGPRVALDREAKIRIMHWARALKHRTEKGRHYGRLTGKYVDVLHALVWLIHDGRTGQCNPSYETIADKAHCARSTVAEAIVALEAAGLLSWSQRLRRIRERQLDLFGRWVWCWRVIRTSNAYVIHAPGGRNTGKSEFPTGPIDDLKNQPVVPVDNRAAQVSPELAAALAGYGQLINYPEFPGSCPR